MVNTVVEAVTAPRPKARYIIGGDAHFLIMLSHFLQDAMLDKVLNIIFGRFASISPFPGPLSQDANMNIKKSD